jgi:peptidylprolyl isomerase
MLTVRLGSDMPAATRPNVYVLDTRTQAFKNLVERERSSKGADFSTCSLEIPSELR